MGLPQVLITFKKQVQEAIANAGSQSVMIMLNETTNPDYSGGEYVQFSDIPTNNFTAQNLQILRTVFMGGASQVIVRTYDTNIAPPTAGIAATGTATFSIAPGTPAGTVPAGTIITATAGNLEFTVTAATNFGESVAGAQAKGQVTFDVASGSSGQVAAGSNVVINSLGYTVDADTNYSNAIAQTASGQVTFDVASGQAGTIPAGSTFTIGSLDYTNPAQALYNNVPGVKATGAVDFAVTAGSTGSVAVGTEVEIGGLSYLTTGSAVAFDGVGKKAEAVINLTVASGASGSLASGTALTIGGENFVTTAAVDKTTAGATTVAVESVNYGLSTITTSSTVALTTADADISALSVASISEQGVAPETSITLQIEASAIGSQFNQTTGTAAAISVSGLGSGSVSTALVNGTNDGSSTVTFTVNGASAGASYNQAVNEVVTSTITNLSNGLVSTAISGGSDAGDSTVILDITAAAPGSMYNQAVGQAATISDPNLSAGSVSTAIAGGTDSQGASVQLPVMASTYGSAYNLTGAAGTIPITGLTGGVINTTNGTDPIGGGGDTLSPIQVLKNNEALAFAFLAAPGITQVDDSALQQAIIDRGVGNNLPAIYVTAFPVIEQSPFLVQLANQNVTARLETGEINLQGAVYENVVFSANQYTGRIASLLAGVQLGTSATFRPLSELIAADPIDADTAINDGQIPIINDGRQFKIGRGITSVTSSNTEIDQIYSKIQVISTQARIGYDIRRNFEDNFLGQVPNVYLNKLMLISSINTYLSDLASQNILDNSAINGNFVDIDYTAQRNYLIEKLGQSTVNSLTEEQILQANTDDWVFLTGQALLTQAMEQLNLVMTLSQI